MFIPTRINDFIKLHIHIILLLCLILLITVSHSLYVLKTYQFPQWDENVYLEYGVRISQLLKHPSLNLWNDVLGITRFRQPLYPTFIAIPLAIFGTAYAYKISLWINIIFYCLTIFGTYLLGKEFLSKKNALISAFIFTFYGFPLFYLHFTLEETVATAFTTFSLLFLVKSRNLVKKKFIIFFSITLAIATLVRWESPIFLIGAFIFILVKNMHSIIRHKKNIVLQINPILLTIIFFLFPMLALYYIPNFVYFKEYVTETHRLGSQWAPLAIKNTLSSPSLVWYINVFAQQTIFFWLLFISGIILAIKKFKTYGILLFSFIFAYLILTIGSSWKDDRFIVPIYPIAAIISCIVLEQLKGLTKKTLIIAIIVLGTLNFLGASWGIGPMKFSINGDAATLPNSIVLSIPIGHPRRVWLAPISWPPRPNEGNVPLILKTIKKDFPYEKGGKPNLLLAFDFSQINEPLWMNATIEDPKAFSFTQLYSEDTSYKLLFQKIHDADYLLTKTGRIFDEPRRGQNVVKMIELFNKALGLNKSFPPKAFEILSIIQVPIDNSTLTIYKKTRALSEDEWSALAKIFSEIDPSSSPEIFKTIDKL